MWAVDKESDISFAECYRFSTNHSLRSKPLRQDLPRSPCSFWHTNSRHLLHLRPFLLPPPCLTPPPNLPCLLSKLQLVCSRAPGNSPSRPPPQAAHPHPATPLLCPPWPPLPTFSKHVCTSASNPTLIPTLASASSLQGKAISPSCPSQCCGAWTRSPGPQIPTCRSWVCLDSSSAAVWWWSKSPAKRDRRMFSQWKS